MVPATELRPTHFLTYHKTSGCPRTTNTMLGLMQYPQRVLLHRQQKRPRTFLAILKYVAAQQPTDRHFRYSNRPIRCSTQLSRYYGRYHEHSHASEHTLPRLARSKRLTAKPAREGSVSMCACTEPVRTGIGAVCVECGRPKWPITMLNYTQRKQKKTPYTPRMTRYEEAFLPEGKKRPRSLRSLGLASL